MGPLESLNIISPELGLILALLVGMGFGFVLEQAGFSSSKKLAGLFYGYDFVVLRVFFTAAITAMLGTILLAYIGVLDLSLIFINPNYSWSALVGGVIMGLGFIIGGFCPGTSLCAVSIGKIDAIVFVIGLFIGSFIFAEGYPLFKGIYSAGYFGDSLIYETLGLSKGVFVLLLVSIAISAFVATYFVELHVNNEKMPKFS